MLVLFLYSQLLIAANESIENLDPVRVRAAKRTAVVEGESRSFEVRPGRHSSFSEVLKEDPAITTMPTFQTDSRIGLRGQDPIQTRYFLEGVPLTEAQFQSGNINFLPIESVGSVTVHSDGVPVVLGEDGLGGGLDFSLVEAKKSQLGARVGSYQNRKVFAHPTLDRGSWEASLHLSYEDAADNYNYFDDGGTPFNSSDDSVQTRSNNRRSRFHLIPNAKIKISKQHDIRVYSLNAFIRTQVPGPISNPTDGELSEFFSVTSLKHRWDMGEQKGSELIYVRLQNGTLSNLPPGNVGIRNGQSRDVTFGTKAEATWLNSQNMMGQASLSIERAEFSFGPEGSPQILKHRRYSVPLGNGVSWKVFGKQLEVSPSLLTQGFRYESDNQGNSKSYLAFSPRLNLRSELHPHFQLRAALGRFHRSPTLMELYGGVQGVTPNSDLEMESANKISMGFDVGREDLAASYTYSVADATNLVTFIQNSQYSQVATNIGKSRIQSHEVSPKAKMPWGTVIKPSAIWLITENRSEIFSQTGRELPYRSPFRFQLEMVHRWNFVEISYGATYYAGVFSDLANTRKLDAFWMHQAGVGMDIKSLGKIRFEIQNLTDVFMLPGSQTDYLTTESFGVAGYPAAGRRMWFTWTIDV